MAEKFCLKWNDFQTNITNSFRKLRTAEDFYDVTLVSDDQQQVSAHKVVLSASSEYFNNILKSNKHSHPLLCLSGVNSKDLKDILDYIYNGEIQIYQENLDSFLNIAQRFKLEGLIQQESDNPMKDENVEPFEDHNTSDKIVVPKAQLNVTKRNEKEKIISVLSSADYQNMEQLDQKLEEMYERQPDGKFMCHSCGKMTRFKRDAMEHAETHIDGLSFPCQYCDKSFRSRSALRSHILKNRCQKNNF